MKRNAKSFADASTLTSYLLPNPSLKLHALGCGTWEPFELEKAISQVAAGGVFTGCASDLSCHRQPRLGGI
ncbi:MAG: hypothetical protein EBX66_00115 [Betaproteobacteria bacterium]|nr:hypothetical protein [Betaproteobacteria bacterium]